MVKKAISIILIISIIVLCVSVVDADDSHIHTYTQKVFERTCTEQGYALHTCECGETYKDKTVPAGHTWDMPETIKEPDASSPGLRKYRCTQCSFEKTVSFNGILTLKDIVYGDDAVRQSVNIIIPKDAVGDCSLVFNIHAGSWKAGDKSQLLESDIKTAESTGIAVASLNFRYLSDETKLDDILDDITNALQKVKDEAKNYGLNIKKVMLQGESSGGHLALLYAYKMKSVSPIEIACVYAFSAPSDLSNIEYMFSKSGKKDMETYLSHMMGEKFSYCHYKCRKEDLQKLSAQYYVDENAVPTGLVHGKFDKSVPYSDSENLHNLLDSYGIKNVLITLPHCDRPLTDERDKDLIKSAYETENVFIAKYLFDYVPGVVKDSQTGQISEHLKHIYKKTSVVNPTCNSRGYTVYKCISCNKTYKDNYISALSHKSSGWKMTKQPTCNSNGFKKKTCIFCNKTVDEEIVNMTPHTVAIDTEVYPTCVKKALSSGSHCSKCNTVLIPQKEIKSEYHSAMQSEIVIPSTLHFQGLKAVRCEYCGKVIS